MPRFRCTRTCTKYLANEKGDEVALARSHHEGELRPLLRIYEEGETYFFETRDHPDIPRKTALVQALDEDGYPKWRRDPLQQDNPMADLLAVPEVTHDRMTGRAKAVEVDMGINHMVEIDANGDPVPDPRDRMTPRDVWEEQKAAAAAAAEEAAEREQATA